MERMSDFFAARVEEYDQHMLTEAEGCKEAYRLLPGLMPRDCKHLLDLGCGTGLELDEIFKVFPELAVTGIDLTQAMLDKLRQKHPHRAVRLICGSYFDVDLGEAEFDCAVSVETMHHFSHAEKIGLYRKIRRSLKENGVYLECDYVVDTDEEEAFYYAENARIRRELGLPAGEFYHYDTPCTVRRQLELFQAAGFSKAEPVFRMGGTSIIVVSR